MRYNICMKKFFLPLLLGILLLSAAIIRVGPIFSDSITDDPQINALQKQITDLSSKLNQSINATTPLESELTSMQNQIMSIKAQVTQIIADVAEKKKNIDQGYQNLAQKEQLLNQTIRDLYIKGTYDSPFLTF